VRGEGSAAAARSARAGTPAAAVARLCNPAAPPRKRPCSARAAVWLFLGYTFLSCAWGLALIGARFLSCSSAAAAAAAACGATLSPAGVLGVVAVALLASLFGIFTGCLAVDQSTIAFTGRTQIDRMKSDDDAGAAAAGGGSSGSSSNLRLWHNLSEVCGGDAAREGFRLTWLLPTRIVYPEPERLTGYCFRQIVWARKDIQLEELEMV